MKYFLSGDSLSKNMIKSYRVISKYSNMLHGIGKDNLKETGECILKFLIGNSLIDNPDNLIQTKNIFSTKSDKILYNYITRLYSIISILKNNKYILFNLSDSSKYIGEKQNIGSLDAVILDRTISRKTSSWLGIMHTDLIVASLDKEKLFIIKTSKDESDKFSPLFKKKTHELIDKKRFKLSDSYGQFKNLQYFQFFNRAKAKKNILIKNNNEIDLDNLIFILKSLEDINLLVKSDLLYDFLLGIEGELVNYSLTVGTLSHERLGKIQGCIEADIYDGIEKRKCFYFSENVDVNLEKGKFYIFGMKNYWGFGKSNIMFSVEVNQQVYKLYLILSYIVNRLRIECNKVDELCQKFDININTLLTHSRFSKIIFKSDKYYFYRPNFIDPYFDVLYENNFDLYKCQTKSLLEYFRFNMEKLNIYKEGWKPNVILNDEISTNDEFLGPQKYGIWVDVLSKTQIKNYFECIGFRVEFIEQYIILMNNNNEIVFIDCQKQLSTKNEIESLLNRLKQNPLLSCIPHESHPKSLVNFIPLHKNAVLSYLYLTHTQKLKISKNEYMEVLKKFLQKDESVVSESIHYLITHKFLLELDKDHFIINPFLGIDFTVEIEELNDKEYLARVNRCLFVYNEPVILKFENTEAGKMRLKRFSKYLNKHTCVEENESTLMVYRNG